jgi:membrane protein implicated in regulation of membrane protease activity
VTIAELYLTCFLVGFALSALSVLLGGVHLHAHLPFHFHLGFHMGHVGHMPHGGAAGGSSTSLPAVNLGTVTAFLAWFGGIGFLLTRHSHVYALAALLISIGGGFVGATLVFLMVTRILMHFEGPMDPADYEMVGVLGRVSSRLRTGGTGEIVYSRQGSRCAAAARSEDEREIDKDVEVVVTRYERGIAYVRRWDELAASAGVDADELHS